MPLCRQKAKFWVNGVGLYARAAEAVNSTLVDFFGAFLGLFQFTFLHSGQIFGGFGFLGNHSWPHRLHFRVGSLNVGMAVILPLRNGLSRTFLRRHLAVHPASQN